MAKVNKVKIAINLIEKAIEDARESLNNEVKNSNYALATVHESRLSGLRQAFNILKACTEEKGDRA